ncbi:hypothetical protein L1887_55584 [Cichorium endivia]|nr:hypothetical protein L1887_55584 [Cichorium endivia]
MVPRTTRSGRVMVPSVSRPMTRCEMRPSTTRALTMWCCLTVRIFGLRFESVSRAMRLSTSGRSTCWYTDSVSVMHGCLRNQPIRSRQAQETRNERRDAEQEKVPVEAGGLAHGIVPRLRHDAADVVVKVEEQHDEEAQRRTHKDVLELDVPKVDEPRTVQRREEGLGDRQPFHGHELERVLGEVAEPRPKDASCGEGVAGDKDGDGDREPTGGIVEWGRFELFDEQLDALLDIDDAHVESERLGGHVGDEARKVAHVEDGDDKVEGGGPDERPGLDAQIVAVVKAIVSDKDVVLRIVDQVDQTRHADKRQRLHREDGEYDGGQCRGEDHLVDAVRAAGAIVHVEDVGERRHEVDEIHAHDAVDERPPVLGLEAFRPVARQERLAASQIVPHASEGAKLVRPRALRPRLVAGERAGMRRVPCAFCAFPCCFPVVGEAASCDGDVFAVVLRLERPLLETFWDEAPTVTEPPSCEERAVLVAVPLFWARSACTARSAGTEPGSIEFMSRGATIYVLSMVSCIGCRACPLGC